MKRFPQILLFFLIWSFSHTGMAQNIKVEYLVKARQSLKYPFFEEPFLLFIDKNQAKSLFISKNKLISEKIISKYIEKKEAINHYEVNMSASDPEMLESSKFKNKFRVIVEKDLKSNNLRYEQDAFMSTLQYQSKLPVFKLQLEDSTKNILGYTVHKASLNYKGRHYTAWYAPKVVVSDGPFKFWGLPGLIFEIYDDKDDYHFSLTGIEFPNKIEFPKEAFRDKSVLVPVIKTTEKKFQKDFEKTFSPSNIIGNSAYIGKHSEEMEAKRVEKFKSKYNNPIELSDE